MRSNAITSRVPVNFQPNMFPESAVKSYFETSLVVAKLGVALDVTQDRSGGARSAWN
jgi:hypothetical protein